MPTPHETLVPSDSQRDAERHHRLLLALNRATDEIGRIEREGHPDIDEVLDRLLPDLSRALNAEQAFVAVLQEDANRRWKWFELAAVYPRKDLRGHPLEWSELLQQLVKDGKPIVIDPLGEEAQGPILGLEIFDATSAVLVRMQAADYVRVVGICNKAHPDLGPYLAADGMALDNIVELVAIGARVGERRRRELEGIQRTSAAISAELDLDELLPMVAKKAAEVFGVPATSLMLWDESEENLVIKAKWGLSDEYMQRQRIPRERVHATVESIGGVQPLLTPNLQLEPFGDINLIKSERLRTVLSAPLLVSAQLIGILNIYSKDKPRQFTSYEKKLSQVFANQAAIAIQNARLRRRELEGLLVTSDAIKATLDPDVLLTLITSKASEVFGAPATSLMLWDEAKENLVIMANEGLSDEYVLQQRVSKERVYAASTLNGEFRPLVTPDLRLEPFGQPELYEKERLCTVLSTPLLVSDKLIGVLNIYSKNEPREFTPGEIELATVFANQAAIAIEIAQLHHQTRQRGEQLAALDQIVLDIAKRLETKELLRAIVERATELVRGVGGGVYLWNEADETFRLEAAYGLSPELEGKRIEKGKGVIGQVLRTRRPFAVADYRHWSGRLRIFDENNLTAVVGVPIMSGNRFLGAIAVHDTMERKVFGEAEKEWLHRFANHAAVAIEQSRLFQQVSEEATRLRLGLLKVGSSISELRSLVDTLKAVAHNIQQVLGCDVVTVYSYDEKSDLLPNPAVVAGKLRVPQKMGGHGSHLTNKIFQLLLEGHESHFADNAPQDEIMSAGGFVKREKIQSSAGVPLLAGSRSVGLLFVNFRKKHRFSEDEKKAIRIFANQAAIAIHNARLYEAIKRQSQHWQALHEASKAITAGFTSERKQVLSRIVEQAVERITGTKGPKAVWSAILLYDEATNELQFESVYPLKVSSELEARLGKRWPLDVDKAPGGRIGITGRTVLEGKPQRVEDVRADPDYLEAKVTTRSELDVPLLDGDRVIGVLSVESDQVGAFDEDDQQALIGLAELAVIAIENAKRYEELKQAHEDLAAATTMAWLGMSGAEWSHAVSQKTSAICYNVNTLRDLIHSPDEVPQEILDDIERAAQEVQNIPMKGPLPAQTGKPVSPIVVDEVLQEWLPRWCEARTDVQLNLQLRCGNEFAYIDGTWLAIALEKVVSNALKAMPNGGRLTVASRVIHNDRLEIIVEDTGVGIPEKAQGYFLRGRVPPEARRDKLGSGMGTLIARFTLRSYGGDLELLQTGEGEGTALRILLPVARESLS